MNDLVARRAHHSLALALRNKVELNGLVLGGSLVAMKHAAWDRVLVTVILVDSLRVKLSFGSLVDYQID